ncbi:tetratricopeptide repeat protein [Xanthobacter tagetidis]|uniref:Sel1 repeat family protein n=1 Tax=Xanthobacter tagetidis TaxID=60216 RepID=A0A3L7AEH6_9HYPH|nr:SEL1-like repeat protein [Xanthobacter tagetidis]MBB6309773.1 hypothetical protein [Xanthobacter tagetidis]RLP78200.1 sel1 repeat family protein [Xanthobacter tagetidis]
MALSVREDDASGPGFALIDLGQPAGETPVRLSFRRSDGITRDLGLDGWQSGQAWLDAQVVTPGGSIVRVGPAVVNHIGELVQVEVALAGVGVVGTVAWPSIPHAAELSGRRLLGEQRPGGADRDRPPEIGRGEKPVPSPPIAPPAPPPILPPILPPDPGAEANTADEKAGAPEGATRDTGSSPEAGGSKRKRAVLGLVLLLVLLALVPVLMAMLGYYGYDAAYDREPRFRQISAARFDPDAVTVTARRARWVRLFEGWLIDRPLGLSAGFSTEAPWMKADLVSDDGRHAVFRIAPVASGLPAAWSAQLTAHALVRGPGGEIVSIEPVVVQRLPRQQPQPAPAPAPRPAPPAPQVDSQRECDLRTAGMLDPDRPPGGAYYNPDFPTQQTAADIDFAIQHCEQSYQVSQDPRQKRRYAAQIGAAYADRAVALARAGDAAGARMAMAEATRWWGVGAGLGSPLALNYLALLNNEYFNTQAGLNFVPPNFPQALRYFVRSAEAGNPVAMSSAGALLVEGGKPGLTKDAPAGLQWLERSIEAGYPPAAVNLGTYYYFGDRGVAADARRGLDLFRRACASDSYRIRVRRNLDAAFESRGLRASDAIADCF